MEERAVRRAWEDFQRCGTVKRGVRTGILASWQRSQHHKIAVNRTASSLLTEGEFHRCRLDHAKLLHAARPALEEARQLLADANAMVILTDPSGTILQTVGDTRAIEFGQSIRLQERGRWNEAVIGTNAIGTAIAVGAPIQIHAYEHFCCEIQKWTCAAAPLRDPLNNDVIGVVDISGPAETFNPQSLAHAVAISHQIQATLLRDVQFERERVLRTFLADRSSRMSEEAIVFGRNGTIIYSTGNALRDIEKRHPRAVIEGRLKLLQGLAPSKWRTRLADMLPQADINLVAENDEYIGGIIVLRAPRRPAKLKNSSPSDPIHSQGFDAIVGESAAIRKACDEARSIAECGQPILLEGETGVGKELFARAIHCVGATNGPFVPVNCGGLPRDLIASEIFGYAKGAFTGADAAGRAGKIEAADGGLLCLDEIGELPLEFQPYFLRVLEDGVVYRVGSHKGRLVDLRVVSMTNRDLSRDVNSGEFRRDLYHRIATFRIRIPPLRERGDDILLLARHFSNLIARSAGRTTPELSKEVMDCLARHAWPGNVRELRNVIQAAVFRSISERIEIDNLPVEIKDSPGTCIQTDIQPSQRESSDLRAIERAAIVAALNKFGGNLTKAAKKLGIARSTLYCRLEKHDLPRGK